MPQKAKVLRYFKDIFPNIPPDDLVAFMNICKFKNCKNKEKVIKEGSTTRNFAFIVSGVFRGYLTLNNEIEKTLFLRRQGMFLGTHDHLFTNSPTKYTYESISDSEILHFLLDDLEAICKIRPSLNDLFIYGLKDTIITLSNRIESMICLSPEERYEELIFNSPIFFNKAFNKHIANYLGITPQSFSRLIKRNMQNQHKNL